MMVVIAREADDDHPVSLSRVSNVTMISRRYLEQLAMGLRRHGLIRGLSGRTGGYVLTRPAGDVSVGDIVEAAIGPINIVDCVLSPGQCVKSDICECRSVYQRINEGIREVMQGLSLEELASSDAAAGQRRELRIEGAECPADGAAPAKRSESS